MKKLIKDLEENKMITNGLYSAFEMGAPFPAGGLIGALIGEAKKWECSCTKEYFYYFKIKNFFSYKGIKWDSLNKIPVDRISKIIWHPKRYNCGTFTIIAFNQNITGTIEYGKMYHENFEKILKFLKTECNIPCEGI